MNNLYRYFSLMFSLLIAPPIIAQQLPSFVGQLEDAALYNPARNGDGIIAVNYRQQWLGLEGDAAPVSYYLHADLSHLLNLHEKRIGLGVQFLGDKAHIISTNRISLDFAYQLIKEPDQRLTAGIRAGFANQSLEFGDVRVNDPFDLELFSGATSGGSFDGGPGVSYYRRMANGGGLHLDLSALQLFADRLDHDGGSFFDWQRHLVARASYRLPLGTGGLQLEPTLVFQRSIDEFQLKQGNLDLAIRGHYLDRFRVSLGTRVSAQTYYLGFAVDFGAATPLGARASYETDDVFGGSYEVGLSYYTAAPSGGGITGTGSTPNSKPPKVDFSSYRAAIASVVESSSTALDRAEASLEEVSSLLAKAKEPGAPAASKRTGLGLAGGKMDGVVTSLRNAATQLDRGRTSIASMRRAANLTAGQELPDRRAQKSVSAFKITEVRYGDLDRQRVRLTEEMSVVQTTASPAVLADFRSGNIPAVERYFTDKMRSLRNPPPGYGPLVVNRNTAGSLELKLPYAKSVAVFDINSPARADVKEMLTLIGWEVKRLRDQGVTVSGITLRAELRDPEEDQLLDEEAGVYSGEFGTSATSFDYSFLDGTNNARFGRTMTINSGDVDFMQLTGLKLESMKRELATIGFNRSDVRLEIAAPVGMNVQERYLVIFEMR